MPTETETHSQSRVRGEAEVLAARFHTIAELQEFGIELMRCNLQRRHPEESPEGIRARLRDWMGDRVQPQDLEPGLVDATAYRRIRP